MTSQYNQLIKSASTKRLKAWPQHLDQLKYKKFRKKKKEEKSNITRKIIKQIRNCITNARIVCVMMMGVTASQDRNLAQLSKVSKKNYHKKKPHQFRKPFRN